MASLRAQIPDGHLAFVSGSARPVRDPRGPGNPEHDEIAASLNPDGAEALLDVAFRHPIRLIANALGPPPPGLVDRARKQGVPVAALVGQPRHAIRQIEAGVDLLIAQGTEAGGHTGTIATMVLTPEIVDIAAGRPVLAAGGIASGRQMAAALALGAAGVWCGSVWLASEEDVANQAIKAKFLAATSSDTVRSRTRTGKPARQLRSAWHEEWEQPGSPAPLPLPLQPMLVNEAWQRIDAAARTGHEGALRLESFFVGQVVGSFEQIRPAGEITRQIVADCEQRIRDLAKLEAAHEPAARRPPHPGPPLPRPAHAGRRGRRPGLRAPRRARLPAALAGRPGRRRGPRGAGRHRGRARRRRGGDRGGGRHPPVREFPSAGAGTIGPFG